MVYFLADILYHINFEYAILKIKFYAAARFAPQHYMDILKILYSNCALTLYHHYSLIVKTMNRL